MDEFSLEIAKAAAEGASRECINKIANAIGGAFPYWGLKRRAIDNYVRDIENSDLAPETKMIAIASAKKTYKHYKNQIEILKIAQESLGDKTGTSCEEIDDEWVDRFMDSAKFVSNETLQLLWGNVLAKEIEEPNSNPPSMIRILSEITPKYAKVFQTLCHLIVHLFATNDEGEVEYVGPQLVLPKKYSYLNSYNVDFLSLNELQLLGLIQFANTSEYVLRIDVKNLHLVYGDNFFTIESYPQKAFPIGCVRLTDAGRALAEFNLGKTIDGHFEKVKLHMKEKNVIIAKEPGIQIVDGKIYATTNTQE